MVKEKDFLEASLPKRDISRSWPQAIRRKRLWKLGLLTAGAVGVAYALWSDKNKEEQPQIRARTQTLASPFTPINNREYSFTDLKNMNILDKDENDIPDTDFLGYVISPISGDEEGNKRILTKQYGFRSSLEEKIYTLSRDKAFLEKIQINGRDFYVIPDEAQITGFYLITSPHYIINKPSNTFRISGRTYIPEEIKTKALK